MIHLYTYSLMDGIMRALILYLLMDFGISSYAVTDDGATLLLLLVCIAAVIVSFLCSAFSLRNVKNKLLLKSYGLSASAFILSLYLIFWLFSSVLPEFSFFPRSNYQQTGTMLYAIVSYVVTLVLRIALLGLSIVRNLRANHRRLGG